MLIQLFALPGPQAASLLQLVATVSVYARANPQHKLPDCAGAAAPRRDRGDKRRRRERCAGAQDGGRTSASPWLSRKLMSPSRPLTCACGRQLRDHCRSGGGRLSIFFLRFLRYLLLLTSREVMTMFFGVAFALSSSCSLRAVPSCFRWLRQTAVDQPCHGRPASRLGIDPADPGLMGRPPDQQANVSLPARCGAESCLSASSWQSALCMCSTPNCRVVLHCGGRQPSSCPDDGIYDADAPS